MSDLGPHGLKPTRLVWHGIPQVRTLEWVAMQASQLRDRTRISYAACVDRRALYHWSRLGSPGLEVTPPPHYGYPAVVLRSLSFPHGVTLFLCQTCLFKASYC